MAAIGCECVVPGREFEVLLNAASVLEAEAKIVYAVQMALLCRAPIEKRRE
jgi:hypothetical protein